MIPKLDFRCQNWWILAGFFVCFAGCNPEASKGPDQGASDGDEVVVVTKEEEKKIVAFCADCHGMPLADSFPKSHWDAEVEQGFQLYEDSERTDLTEPPRMKVLAYFRNDAPEVLPEPEIKYAETPQPVEFKRVDWAIPEGDDPPSISHVRFTRDVPGLGTGLLTCDMRHGYLRFSDPNMADAPHVKLAQFTNPAHVEPADLDNDGKMDFVLGDLGQFQPADHSDGSVQWLRSVDDGSWQPEALLKNAARVAVVQPGDFTGNGRQDLVVAEFGWRQSGSVRLLKSGDEKSDIPKFQSEEVDARHGAIQVPTCDLNGDGKLDFITILSQEHEMIVAYLNDGNGSFTREVIFDSPDPSYGSSGIELVDLDQDGDQDVLYTNGDTFDDFLIKPYHSIQWLENEGKYPFTHHELTKMPGVHRALAGDLDGDDDLDIIAVALLAEQTFDDPAEANFDSVIMLEQTAPGVFVRHRLASGMPLHAAFDMGDFDQDGDLDFAVGWFLKPSQTDHSWMTIWWNQHTP